MRKFTDFELAAASSAGALAGDLFWLANDIIHAGRFDHCVTAAVLLVGCVFCVYSVIVHKKTGSKPVQHTDDIAYHVHLALLKHKLQQPHIIPKLGAHRAPSHWYTKK